MKKILISMMILGSVATASEAVKELNYSLRADTSTESDQVFGIITAPISNYVGISVNTKYSENIKRRYRKSKYKYISSDIFLRDNDIGEVGLKFAYGKNEVSESAISYDVKSKKAFIYANYYMNDFTFFADTSYYDLKLDVKKSKYNSSVNLSNGHGTYYNFGTSWYFQDDTKANFIYGNNFDNDYNRYDFLLAYQPELFKNSVEVGLSYSVYDKRENTAIALSISYHFMKATLKDRDREYR